MSVKSIVIKTVLGIVILSLLAMVVLFLSKPEKPLEEESIPVYYHDENLVESIEVTGPDGFKLYKDENTWVMDGMEGVGVTDAYASALVKSMTGISSPMIVEAEAEDLSVYGLENPEVTVRLRYADGEAKINIGSTSGEYYYLCVEGKKTVYIVSAQDLYMVFMERADYLETTVVDVDASLITKVSYPGVKIEKGEDNAWREISPYERLADEAAVKNKVLSRISSIEGDDVIKRDEAEGRDAGGVRITLSDGDEIALRVLRGEENYVIPENSEYAYLVDDDKLTFLDVTGYDLLNKYIAPVSIEKVTKIALTSSKGTSVITIDAPSSEAPIFYLDGKEADEVSVRAFYEDLVGLTVNGEGTASGAAEYAIIMTLENGEKTDIRFISLSESDFAVSINGKTQFTANKKSVTDVFEKIEDIVVL